MFEKFDFDNFAAICPSSHFYIVISFLIIIEMRTNKSKFQYGSRGKVF